MIKKSNKKILIVGQGIAGTCAAHEALKAGMAVTIIDRGSDNCASATSSGLNNPITGRNFVKSWMIESFMDAAVKIYGEIPRSIKCKSDS